MRGRWRELQQGMLEGGEEVKYSSPASGAGGAAAVASDEPPAAAGQLPALAAAPCSGQLPQGLNPPDLGLWG